MARLPVTRWLAGIAAVLLLPGLAPARAPEPPAGLQLWPTRSLHGVDCVSVRDIAERFGLKAVWEKPDLVLTLSDASGVRFAFESRRRDFHFDNLRVFLGEPAVPEENSLWVTKLDVIKIVAPLFRPADHLSFLPAAAPHVIVIDPGHGGSDPGKENRLIGTNEKTATLDVALRLRKILEGLGWKVLLTRTEDRDLSPVKVVDLRRRDDFANQAQADLFLSIHFNSVEKDTERVTGVETYLMTPQFMFSTADERKDDMTDTAFPGNKLDYANLLLGEQMHRAMLSSLRASDRGLKHSRYAVLRFVECPGALIECAYLSNNPEARRVATPEYREKIAQALATGVQNYAAILSALRPPPEPAPKAAAPAAAPAAHPVTPSTTPPSH